MSFPDMVDSMGSAGQTGGDNTPTKEELTKFKTQQAKYAEDRRKFIEAKYKDFKNGHNYFKRVLAGNIHSADWKGIFEFANSLNNIFKLDESLKSVVTLSGWFSRPDATPIAAPSELLNKLNQLFGCYNIYFPICRNAPPNIIGTVCEQYTPMVSQEIKDVIQQKHSIESFGAELKKEIDLLVGEIGNILLDEKSPSFCFHSVTPDKNDGWEDFMKFVNGYEVYQFFADLDFGNYHLIIAETSKSKAAGKTGDSPAVNASQSKVEDGAVNTGEKQSKMEKNETNTSVSQGKVEKGQNEAQDSKSGTGDNQRNVSGSEKKEDEPSQDKVAANQEKTESDPRKAADNPNPSTIKKGMKLSSTFVDKINQTEAEMNKKKNQ